MTDSDGGPIGQPATVDVRVTGRGNVRGDVRGDGLPGRGSAPGRDRARRRLGGSAQEAEPSPLQVALDRVGDRWSLLIVERLLGGPRRFNDLQDALPGIAPNILTERLRRLERERVVVSRRYSQRPPRLSYELTADGLELAGALRLLADWGTRGSSGDGAAALRHEACGTPVEARWYCPTCARTVGESEASELRRL